MIFLAGGFNAGGTGPCYVFASWVAVERGGGHNVRYEVSGHGSATMVPRHGWAGEIHTVPGASLRSRVVRQTI